MDDLAGLARGRLSIWASQTIASYWLSPRLTRFHKAHPGIRLEVEVGNTAQVAKAANNLVMWSCLIANHEAFEWPEGRDVELWNPYRAMFDVVWSGRRHVIMGASQIDAYGNHIRYQATPGAAEAA